jgi:hypothetical protein
MLGRTLWTIQGVLGRRGSCGRLPGLSAGLRPQRRSSTCDGLPAGRSSKRSASCAKKRVDGVLRPEQLGLAQALHGDVERQRLAGGQFGQAASTASRSGGRAPARRRRGRRGLGPNTAAEAGASGAAGTGARVARLRAVLARGPARPAWQRLGRLGPGTACGRSNRRRWPVATARRRCRPGTGRGNRSWLAALRGRRRERLGARLGW